MNSRFPLEYRIGVLLLATLAAVAWQTRPTSDPTLPGRVKALELDSANADTQTPSKPDDGDEAASKEAVASLRKLAEDLPSREYIDGQMDILRKQADACGNAASALRGALTTITGSGLTSLDINQVKGIPAKLDMAIRNFDLATNEITGLEAQVGTAMSKINAMTNKVTDVESQIDDVLKKYDSATNEIASLETHIKAQDTQIQVALNKGDQNASAIQKGLAEIPDTKPLGDADVRKIVISENAKLSSEMNSLQSSLGGYATLDDLESAKQQFSSQIQKTSNDVQTREDGIKADVSRIDAEGVARVNDIKTLSDNQQTLLRGYDDIKALIKNLIAKISPSTSPGGLQAQK